MTKCEVKIEVVGGNRGDMMDVLGAIDPLFVLSHTSLEDLEAAGYSIRQSLGGSWWWEKNGGGDHISVPYWVRQIVHRAGECGELRAKNDMRLALGMEPLKEKKPKKKKGAE